MIQPEELKSAAYLPWSRGRGTDVWAMLKAAADGDLPAVQALAATDPNLLDCEFHYYRPLHFAVRENRIEVVKFLLDQGADPMCGGLGFQPAYRPRKPGNHQWPFDMARERGYAEVLALLEAKLAERHKIRPEGESLAALIRARDIAQVGAVLDARPELIDAADAFGNQPIHWATMTRQMPLIDLLLARGADIDARRPDGNRPLDLTNGDYHYRGWRDVLSAALRRHEVLIGYLLARGADYDIGTAAQLGDLEHVRALLDQNPALVNEVPPSTGYYTGVPLKEAAGGGHLEIVKLLLERGADPNRPEPVAPNGAALYDAIAGRHWEIVKLLLAHGANPNAAVESSGDCVWRARRDGAPAEILALLAERGGVYSLELACHDGDVAYIETLLQKDPALPIQEHLPAGNKAMVELVLRYQPDVLKQKVFDGAPNPAHARWLFARGMDPTRPNWLGITPLHRAALNGVPELAALLLEFGAELDPIDDEFSSTPLGWAARGGQTGMVKWLLDRGANRDLPLDKSWARPAEWARREGHQDIVKLLEP